MDQEIAIQPKDPIKLEDARQRLTRNRTELGIARLHKVLCDPARLRIIEALAAGPLCVNDLSLAIERAPAATSQHLRVLRQMDLVEGVRRGTSVYYSLKQGAATQIDGVLHCLAELPMASNG